MGMASVALSGGPSSSYGPHLLRFEVMCVLCNAIPIGPMVKENIVREPACLRVRHDVRSLLPTWLVWWTLGLSILREDPCPVVDDDDKED
ncbi:jg5439 [Pararge aegeria aegeria]|uniref:Jg5439 protein n=1 Tax=Pararge aegeria aegeria TaxID=348720 RepID=A0A8S4SBP4_9NEOP|nr:jg5439 [Pararge aegeria aegeria]